SRKSGGMGGYAEYAFGKSGYFMANYTYGVSLLNANVAIAISAIYVLSANGERSPVNDHPLCLFNPQEDAQILEKEYGIPRRYLG
ncbi:hypothetical protein MJN85_31695, partial [Salmonella enterica subsp. enterica serovar Anatum]|nr:hypothetical protein [Salmonella enterica subsp. enterica serovar Anatum]